MRKKKKFLARSLGVAAWALGSTAVFAIQTPSGADADSLQVSESGIGHMLVVPYYSTQSGNATLLSLINADEVNGKAVKLRFRGALNADNVYDFQVFLAPGDMWTANISQNANGLSYITTEDASCTKPAKSTINSTPFSTSRLDGKADAASRANGTREGYLEIITLADIAQGKTGIFPLIDVRTDKALCADSGGNDAWSALNTNLADAAAYASRGLTPPTSGLMANWTVMNVPKALAWSGSALALEARKGDAPAKGNLVYFPQSDATFADASKFSADPLFAGERPALAPAVLDLPDLSTPYYAGVSSPNAQANAVAAALEVKSIVNEYWTMEEIHAKTDWLISMPTRRFALGANYAQSDLSKRIIFNPGVAGHFGSINMRTGNGSACLSSPATHPWDRDGHTAMPSNEIGSGIGPSAPRGLCGATNVTSINSPADVMSDVLAASIALNGWETAYYNGWGRIEFLGTGGLGIPAIGSAFVKAYNPAVAPGTAGNFGVVWPHRLIKN